MVRMDTFAAESTTILTQSTVGNPAPDFTDQKIFGTDLMAALVASRQKAASAPADVPAVPRPTRDEERLQETIASVIPDGFSLCINHWYRAVCSMVRGADLYANRKQSILAVARAIHLAHDKGTGIFMAGVKALVTISRIAKATVNRALATLRSWNLLATVAEGRSLKCTPSKKQNDRAVWALLLPVDENGDEFETPSKAVPVEPVEDTPKPLQSWANFARKACGSGEYKPLPRDQWDAPLWHGHAITSSIEDEALATQELMRRLFLALGKSRLALIQSVLTPFLRRGTTIVQLLRMIDYRPDGSMWPHDGATGVKNPAAWLRNRLSAWSSN